MNKNIKFRAFHKKLKGGLFIVCSIDLDGQTVELQRAEFFITADFSEVDIVQFTGLLDKNGKEIYEGDIVELNHDTSDVNWSSLLTRVVWWNNGFYLEETQNKVLVQDTYYQFKYCKIIGNIFQNPELLK